MQLPDHILNPDPYMYMSENYVVFDVETTNKDKGTAVNPDNELVLAVWGKGGDYKSIYGNEYDMGPLVEALESADFIVAQNAKFDLQWAARAGLDLTKVVVYDTMLGAYVEDGNQMKPRDLNSLVKRYGVPGGKVGLVDKLIKGGVCPSLIPRSWLERYGEADVRLCEDVFIKQRALLYDSGLLPVMFTRCLFTPVLADVEFNGMHLDAERVDAEYRRLCYELSEVEDALSQITGGINPRSPKQLSVFLYETLKFPVPKRYGTPIKTKAGNYPTDKNTIAKLKPRNKRQRRFLELKAQQGKLNAALTKNIQFFQGACEERGGIFTAQFNQAITKTHRLSSSGRPVKFEMFDKPKSVQFQNMPRIYKKLFCARHADWNMAEIDQAQLEFRTAVELGDDKQGREDIKNGFDVHSFTAAIINDVDLEWVLKNKESDPLATAYRQAAKADTFKPLFGGESGTDSQRRYYKAFKEKYSSIAQTQEKWLYEVLDKKKLVLKTGLICYWPDTEVTESGYITNTTKIYNLPIQNLATAEVVPVGVTYQWHRMKAAQMQSFLVNSIHDSSIGEVHPDEQYQYASIGQQAFVDDVMEYMKKVYNINLTVPLEAEVDIYKHWGEKLKDK